MLKRSQYTKVTAGSGGGDATAANQVTQISLQKDSNDKSVFLEGNYNSVFTDDTSDKQSLFKSSDLSRGVFKDQNNRSNFTDDLQNSVFRDPDLSVFKDALYKSVFKALDKYGALNSVFKAGDNSVFLQNANNESLVDLITDLIEGISVFKDFNQKGVFTSQTGARSVFIDSSGETLADDLENCLNKLISIENLIFTLQDNARTAYFTDANVNDLNTQVNNFLIANSNYRAYSTSIIQEGANYSAILTYKP